MITDDLKLTYQGGSLFQPVFKGQRTDLEVEACSMGQLKFKRDVAEPEPVAADDGPGF